MRRLAVPTLALLLSPLASVAADAGEGDRSRAPAPRLDYRFDGYADDRVTYGSPTGGRWVGTWYGSDGSRFNGTYESGGATPPASVSYPLTDPDPALYGSGRVVNGWYYPKATETRTVIEYRQAR